MTEVKRLVLDVLKPHQPNALEFARGLAALHDDYRVTLRVIEVDEKTETVNITILGRQLDYPAIEACISDLGGSVHSIDEVEVQGARAGVASEA